MDTTPGQGSAEGTLPHAQANAKHQRVKVSPIHRLRATVQKLRRALRSNRGFKEPSEQVVRENQAVEELPLATATAISQDGGHKIADERGPISEDPALAGPAPTEANREALEDELEKGQEAVAEAAANLAEQNDAYRVLGREVWNSDGTDTVPTDAQLEAELYAEMRAEGYDVPESSDKVGPVDGLRKADYLQDVDNNLDAGADVDLDIDEFSNEEASLEEAAAIDSLLEEVGDVNSDVEVDVDDIDDVDENGETHNEEHYMALAQQHLRTAENMLQAKSDIRS